jgi:hypothetical protein
LDRHFVHAKVKREPERQEKQIMSKTGRKTVLDDAKRGEIRGLLASGISLRQAARCVGCDPHTIRREMQRNDAFREEIERSKKLLNTAPFSALMEAAKTNWRAAAWVLERLQPEVFAKQKGGLLAEADIERFVHAICDVIGECSTHSLERDRLHDLLGHIMPAEFRPAWDRQQRRRLRLRSSGIHWRLGDRESFDKSGNPLHPVTEHSSWAQSPTRSAAHFASPADDSLQKQAAASPPRRNEPDFASPSATDPCDSREKQGSVEANRDAFRPENEFIAAGRNREPENAPQENASRAEPPCPNSGTS